MKKLFFLVCVMFTGSVFFSCQQEELLLSADETPEQVLGTRSLSPGLSGNWNVASDPVIFYKSYSLVQLKNPDGYPPYMYRYLKTGFPQLDYSVILHPSLQQELKSWSCSAEIMLFDTSLHASGDMKTFMPGVNFFQPLRDESNRLYYPVGPVSNFNLVVGDSHPYDVKIRAGTYGAYNDYYTATVYPFPPVAGGPSNIPSLGTPQELAAYKQRVIATFQYVAATKLGVQVTVTMVTKQNETVVSTKSFTPVLDLVRTQ